MLQETLVFCLGDKGEHYLDSIFEVINRFIYAANPLTEKMWAMFPIVLYRLCGYANFAGNENPNVSQEIVEFTKKYSNQWDKNQPCGEENIFYVFTIVKNFLISGKDQFLSRSDVFGKPYMNLLFEATAMFITKNKENIDQSHVSNAFIIIGSIFSSFSSPALDSYVSDMMKYSVDTAKGFSSSNLMENVFYHNVCLGLHYNTTQIIELLKSNGVLEPFLNELVKTFKRSVTYRIRKAIMMGLLSLYSLDNSIITGINVDLAYITNVIAEHLPLLYDEQRQMIEGMFNDVYEEDDEEDAKEIVNPDQDPLLAKILEESKKLKKNLKKTEDEDEALQA